MPINYYLQPNPITPDPNDRSARVAAKETFDLEDIIKRMVKRGTMVTEMDIQAILNLFFDETCDLVADGYYINLPLANLRPSVKGVFKDANDVFDKSRHSVRASLSAGLLLQAKMAQSSAVKVSSAAPSPALTFFDDINSGTSDSVLTSSGIGRITGEELKFDPTQVDEGVFFIASDKTETRVDVIASLTEGQVMFMVPPLTAGDYLLEVRKAYTASRVIRIGKLDHALTVGTAEAAA